MTSTIVFKVCLEHSDRKLTRIKQEVVCLAAARESIWRHQTRFSGRYSLRRQQTETSGLLIASRPCCHAERGRGLTHQSESDKTFARCSGELMVQRLGRRQRFFLTKFVVSFQLRPLKPPTSATPTTPCEETPQHIRQSGGVTWIRINGRKQLSNRTGQKTCKITGLNGAGSQERLRRKQDDANGANDENNEREKRV